MESQNIVKIAANALNSKKARQLKALQIDNLTTLADYFVIATATSSTHVRALADEVEEKLKEAQIEKRFMNLTLRQTIDEVEAYIKEQMD